MATSSILKSFDLINYSFIVFLTANSVFAILKDQLENNFFISGKKSINQPKRESLEAKQSDLYQLNCG